MSLLTRHPPLVHAETPENDVHVVFPALAVAEVTKPTKKSSSFVVIRNSSLSEHPVGEFLLCVDQSKGSSFIELAINFEKSGNVLLQ